MEDYFEPALQVNHPDGNTSTLLKYKSHSVNTSPDGDNGFPGNLRATVGYTWTDDNRLQIRFEAISGRSYNNHDGIAFECQGFTDACNHPEYPAFGGFPLRSLSPRN